MAGCRSKKFRAGCRLAGGIRSKEWTEFSTTVELEGSYGTFSLKVFCSLGIAFGCHRYGCLKRDSRSHVESMDIFPRCWSRRFNEFRGRWIISFSSGSGVWIQVTEVRSGSGLVHDRSLDKAWSNIGRIR